MSQRESRNKFGPSSHPSTSWEQREARALDVYQPYVDLLLTILGITTLSEISLRLDPDDTLHRNWAMMGELMGFDNWEIKWFKGQGCRAGKMIENWSSRGPHTLGELIDLVHRTMERRDIFTDERIIHAILCDVERDRNGRRPRHLSQPNPTSFFSSPSRFSGLNTTTTTLVGRYQGSQSESRGAVQPSHFTRFNSSSKTVTSEGFSVSEWLQTSPSAHQEQADVHQQPDSTTSPPPTRKRSGFTGVPDFDVYVLCDPKDVFVRDELIPKFEQNSVRICFPEHHIPLGGDRFNDTMDYMLNKCRKIAVVLSDELFEKQETEWLGCLALGEGKDILRDRIFSIKYKALTVQRIAFGDPSIDFTTTSDEESAWKQILQNVKPQVL